MRSKEENRKRHADAGHAMQTGVAHDINVNGDRAAGVTPKHLRVGVNSAMSDQEGLARLLIAKGVFTEDEYFEAVADAMEREKDRYEAKFPGVKLL